MKRVREIQNSSLYKVRWLTMDEARAASCER